MQTAYQNLLKWIPQDESKLLCTLTLAEFIRRGDLIFRLFQPEPPRLGLWLVPTPHVRYQIVGSLHLHFGWVWLADEVANLAGVGLEEVAINDLFGGWSGIIYQRRRA